MNIQMNELHGIGIYDINLFGALLIIYNPLGKPSHHSLLFVVATNFFNNLLSFIVVSFTMQTSTSKNYLFLLPYIKFCLHVVVTNFLFWRLKILHTNMPSTFLKDPNVGPIMKQ
jgi:hypothetical protein